MLAPTAVLAHGADAAPTLAGALTTVVLDPLPWIGSIIAIGGYLWLVARIRSERPRVSVPTWRIGAWIAGVLTILVALVSGLDEFADSLLSVHMVQHLVLAMVAPPLLALGTPVTVLLRAASTGVRRAWLLPILHSRTARFLGWPIVAWSLFAAVMWFVHFTPFFEAALENPTVHELEHGAFFVSGMLFWWPVIAADPIPHRMSVAGRIAYLVLQMPVNAAVGLVIYFAPLVLYPHYLLLARTWGPSPLVDQQIGGLIMWTAGDLILLAAITGVVANWVGADARRARRADARRLAEVVADPAGGARSA